MGKLRIGFIGAGGIARSHMQRLAAIPEAQVVAFTEPSPDAMERMVADYPEAAHVPVFMDHLDMLDEVEIDAVQIHTPHTLHHQQILDCLASGKHVLCEKPLVCSVAHAREVMAAQGDRVLMISYQRHFQGPDVYIRDRILSGQLGELTYVSALQGQNWLHSQRGQWRSDPALSGGGQLNDSGSHLVDILLWTTGLVVSKVYASINRYDLAVDIDSAISLCFANGARGSIAIVGHSPMWWEEFSVWGTRGALLYRNGTIVERRFDEDHMVEPASFAADSTPDRNFVDVILGRDSNRVPAECGLRVIELTEAAWRSAELGRPVGIDELTPKGEEPCQS